MKRSKPYYHGAIVGVDPGTKWKRPVSKQTAAELLYKADDGEITLTRAQTESLERIAGKEYRANAGLAKRKGETDAQYIARIKKTLARKVA